MQFSTLFVCALASVATAYKVGAPFGLMAIRSGSRFQYAGFNVENDVVSFKGSKSLEGTFLADGRVQVGDKFLAVNGDQLVLSATGSTFSDDGGDHFTIPNHFFLARPKDQSFDLLVPKDDFVSAKDDLPFIAKIVYLETPKKAHP